MKDGSSAYFYITILFFMLFKVFQALKKARRGQKPRAGVRQRRRKMFANNSTYLILILIMILVFSRDGEVKGPELIIVITTVIAMFLVENRKYDLYR